MRIGAYPNICWDLWNAGSFHRTESNNNDIIDDHVIVDDVEEASRVWTWLYPVVPFGVLKRTHLEGNHVWSHTEISTEIKEVLTIVNSHPIRDSPQYTEFSASIQYYCFYPRKKR